MASIPLMTKVCTMDTTGSWTLGKNALRPELKMRKRRTMDHVLCHEGQWPAVREGAKPMDMEGRLMASESPIPSHAGHLRVMSSSE